MCSKKNLRILASNILFSHVAYIILQRLLYLFLFITHLDRELHPDDFFLVLLDPHECYRHRLRCYNDHRRRLQ